MERELSQSLIDEVELEVKRRFPLCVISLSLLSDTLVLVIGALSDAPYPAPNIIDTALQYTCDQLTQVSGEFYFARMGKYCFSVRSGMFDHTRIYYLTTKNTKTFSLIGVNPGV